MCSVKIVQRCCQMCSVRSFWLRKSRRSRATPGSDPSHLLPVPVFLSALSVFPKTNKHPFPSRLRFHLATLIMSDQTLQFAGVRSMLFSSSVLMLLTRRLVRHVDWDTSPKLCFQRLPAHIAYIPALPAFGFSHVAVFSATTTNTIPERRNRPSSTHALTAPISAFRSV